MEPVSSPNVTELIHRAKGGDEACRDRLFEICRNYLGILARAQVESWLQVKVDASDVVQQTMMEAFKDFDRFQGASEKEWMAWLRRILAHNMSDFVRRYRTAAKRGAAREIPIRNPAESTAAGGAPEPADRGGTPSQELIRLDNELRVAAALTQLPADYQEVIVLRNLQRLSFNEVAERMDRSRPAVQMLWMRAIKKLRETIGEEEDDG